MRAKQGCKWVVFLVLGLTALVTGYMVFSGTLHEMMVEAALARLMGQ
jgi:hypothetical protein